MPDWMSLHDAYGSAESAGAMLNALDAGAGIAEVDWDELWSRLCHQSTVYTASVHALPYLLRAALRGSPETRLEPLVLAGAIVAHGDDVPVVLPGHAQVLQSLDDCSVQTLRQRRDAPGAETDVVYLLQAVLAFRGERLWSRHLAGVLQGELSGVCPACQSDLYIVIDDAQAFVTDQEWIGGRSVPKAPIDGGDRPPASEAEAWLLGMAQTHGGALAEKLPLLFGTSRCTHCGAALEIGEAVRLAS